MMVTINLRDTINCVPITFNYTNIILFGKLKGILSEIHSLIIDFADE